jgi:hypothetical protein
VGKEIEVVNCIGHRHAHIETRSLESGESTGAVAQSSRVAGRQPPSQHVGRRMETEDVADLKNASGSALRFRERSSLAGRERERLLDEAGLASVKTFAGQAKVCIRRGHEIHRINLGKDDTKIRDCPGGGDSCLNRERAALLGRVRNPEIDAKLSEHADVLLSPATEPDQEDLQWRGALSLPRSSAIS